MARDRGPPCHPGARLLVLPVVPSYSSIGASPRRLLRQAAELRRVHGDPAEAVKVRLARAREVDALLVEAGGREIAGLDLLDIGCGQLPAQLIYFSRNNRVVGIDTDVLAVGMRPAPYVRMLRVNGVQRTLKTVGRKLLRVDAQFYAELLRQLDLRRRPSIDARVMSAESLAFAAESFDVVYALAVFQHLAHPENVLEEMVRVLRPGGVLYLDFILYTSQTGSHDLRLVEGGHPSLPAWAHLRPQYRELVSESAFLNGLRLPEWREHFDRIIPGASVQPRQVEGSQVRAEAERLQQEGELVDYDMEELCTTKVVVVWQKPPVNSPAPPAAH
jgi:SAM-dependent methyltransferase